VGTLVLYGLDSSEGAGVLDDDVGLVRILEIDPVALVEHGGSREGEQRAAGKLRPEVLVGLIVRLERDALDVRLQGRGLQLLLDRSNLGRARGRPAAVSGVVDARAEVDGDLRAVVPVPLHLADLHLHEDRRAHERERDEGHEDDRDDHRDVATQPLRRFAENQSEPHALRTWGPGRSSRSPKYRGGSGALWGASPKCWIGMVVVW